MIDIKTQLNDNEIKEIKSIYDIPGEWLLAIV